MAFGAEPLLRPGGLSLHRRGHRAPLASKFKILPVSAFPQVLSHLFRDGVQQAPKYAGRFIDCRLAQLRRLLAGNTLVETGVVFSQLYYLSEPWRSGCLGCFEQRVCRFTVGTTDARQVPGVENRQNVY